MSTLTDETSQTATTAEFPVITTKYRDEHIELPDGQRFRRAGLYNCIKVLLHHNLVLHCGRMKGITLYKAIMLAFMNQLGRELAEYKNVTLNVDLINELLTKLGRRHEKLDMLLGFFRHAALDAIGEHVLLNTKKTISMVRCCIDHQIGALQVQLIDQAILKPLQSLKLTDDIKQRIQKLDKYLRSRKQGFCPPPPFKQAIQPKFSKRHLNRQSPPDAITLDQLQNDIESLGILHDVESYILYSLPMDGDDDDDDEDNPIDMDCIRQLTFNFFTKAALIHDTDHYGRSRMILCRLKLLYHLDLDACNVPLLLQYRPGISLYWFKKLLLPHQRDMQIAYKLECYFRSRHQIATFPSMIDQPTLTENAFGVRFARDNPAMQEMRQTILQNTELAVSQKQQEWTERRRSVEILRRREHELHCEYVLNRNEAPVHAIHCHRCRIKHMIEDSKIWQYEKALPDSETEQFGIVFELCIPVDIAFVRDAVHAFNLFGNATFNKVAAFDWSAADQLRHLWPANRNQSVRLGHLRQAALRQIHVDEPFGSFILTNFNESVYHVNRFSLSQPVDDAVIDALTTLKVEPNSPYATLQWTVDTTDHTQNAVLAKQCHCTATITLAEYKNFGSLRADGCRLQLRKLYAMLECEALSFEQASVLTLCLQTIWEQNERGDCGWIRDAHQDLQNTEFATALIDLLTKYMTKQRNNWLHPFKLLLAVVWAVRCFELNENESVASKCAELIRNMRMLAIEWCQQIEDIIHNMEETCRIDERELRQKLIWVTIIGCMTYFVPIGHTFYGMIYGDDDTRHWLQFVVTLNNNVALNGNAAGVYLAKTNLSMFLRIVMNIGVEMEEKMHEMIEKNPMDLYEFVCERWLKADDGQQFERVSFMKENPQILVIQMNSKHVTVDIIDGTFLVNNLPIARLPGELNCLFVCLDDG